MGLPQGVNPPCYLVARCRGLDPIPDLWNKILWGWRLGRSREVKAHLPGPQGR